MDDTISGNVTFEYATFGQCSGCGGKSVDRMIRETTPLGSIAYAYDALGRRTSMTVAGESPVEYTYDENGRLVGVTHGDIGTALMEYDDAGRRTLLTLPNGTATSYAYDASSRLLALTHAGASGTIEKPTYTYDTAGNRVSLTTLNPQAELPAVVTAAVDAANRLLSHNEENLTYDANGNLVAGTDASGTTTYTWDARNRLVAMEGPSVTASFKYDAFNRRTEKTVNDKRTQYLYDGVDIIAEVEDGIITAKYLRSLSIDEVFARMDSTGMRYYHKDGLGSTVALTDSSGHVTTRYTYGPFGETTVTGDSDANPFQYTGREWDQETGLYYYRARYYDPRWGRFISEDPIRFAGGDVNVYAYVQNDPINWIDPWGLDATNWNNTAGGRSRWDGPTNGNWGGGCWSGGQYSCGGNPMGGSPPTDSADACYERHDKCYDAAGQNNPRGIAACDQQLVNELRNLNNDSRLWPQPARPGTERDSESYRNKAIWWFRR